MNTLFFDCTAGIAGNMVVASLLDLGVDQEAFKKALLSIQFPEGSLKFECRKILKNGITACYFNTSDDNHHEQRNLGNKRTIHLSNKKEDFNNHKGNHDSSCNIEHSIHTSSNKHKRAHGRNFKEICELINNSELSKTVKERSIECFELLGQIEAKIHGTTIDKIHFHEIGARDTIADIVGAIFCIEELKVSNVFTSPINIGSGVVNCDHGCLPVPAPATAELLSDFQIFQLPGIDGELTTPTGAALLKCLKAQSRMPSPFVYSKIGYGAGYKDLPIPNVLRAFLGNSAGKYCAVDSVVMLETNLDNATGELLGYVADLLMQAGALDVVMIPVLMKKGRPGTILSVMASPDKAERLEKIMFNELPTLGIRRQFIMRSTLLRENVSFETTLGKIKGKVIYDLDGTKRSVPEFDEVIRIANQNNISARQAIVLLNETLKNVK